MSCLMRTFSIVFVWIVLFSSFLTILHFIRIECAYFGFTIAFVQNKVVLGHFNPSIFPDGCYWLTPRRHLVPVWIPELMWRDEIKQVAIPSTWISIGIASMAVSILPCSRRRSKVDATVCDVCKYDRTGIGAAAPCPECGSGAANL